ncbi:hypothetical protein ZWY2020_057565 [Hordeum vulgare]|nr:hypothetical protein ZWY2020_057565 [Hordeum vulgare]
MRISTWVAKESDCDHIADAELWLCDGVLSHEGFLWWFNLSSCILTCDPFEDNPRLYQIRSPHVPHTLPQCRCILRLRYVQIHGAAAGQKPVVSMWTLSSNNLADAALELTHKVPLAEIWSHQTYKSKSLSEDVPTVPLVHPMKPNLYTSYTFGISKILNNYENLGNWHINHFQRITNCPRLHMKSWCHAGDDDDHAMPEDGDRKSKDDNGHIMSLYDCIVMFIMFYILFLRTTVA